MDIDKYKYAMDSIEMKKFTVEELEDRIQQKRKQKKYIEMVMAVSMIMLAFIISIGFFSKNNLVTITVYANSGKRMVLSEKTITYNVDSSISSFQYFKDSNSGILNIKLFFEFEGKRIDKITISSSENKIGRKDLENVNAYLVKTKTVKMSDYNTVYEDIVKSDTFLWSLENPQEDEVTFVILTGNSYTFKYDEQNNEQYGLAINASKNENNKFSNKEIVLNVKIKYLDGSEQNKRIKIAANDDIFSGIQMTLL